MYRSPDQARGGHVCTKRSQDGAGTRGGGLRTSRTATCEFILRYLKGRRSKKLCPTDLILIICPVADNSSSGQRQRHHARRNRKHATSLLRLQGS
jgi:hypothetical protein